jgi:hypothetical protein
MRTMRTSSSIVLACLGFHLGAASCHPPHSRQPQLGAASRPHRNLHALRGGGRTSTAAVVERQPPQLLVLTRTPRHTRALYGLYCAYGLHVGYTHHVRG